MFNHLFLFELIARMSSDICLALVIVLARFVDVPSRRINVACYAFSLVFYKYVFISFLATSIILLITHHYMQRSALIVEFCSFKSFLLVIKVNSLSKIWQMLACLNSFISL
jgi:hypothetical protein